MKKIISITLISLILLSSCWKTEDLVTWDNKKDFLITVKNINELSKSSVLEKTWVIEWKEDIKLNSQWIWRISNIVVKEWDKVSAWETLVYLSDTTANYGINLERAGNMLEKMEINYDSTKISLDKQIFDIEIALEKLKSSYETAKINSLIDVSQARDNLENTDYTWMDTKSSLELQKLDNSISKMELDYNNLLSSNAETIEGYKSNVKKEQISQNLLIGDILQFSDKLFDISWLYSDDVDKFKDFLWTNNLLQKSQTRDLVLDLMQFRDNTLSVMDFSNLTEEKILEIVTSLDNWYVKVDKLLSSLERTINNSVVSVGQLSQSQIDSYWVSINAYQSQFSLNNSAFVAFKNAVSTFLKTYKNNESSISKQIDLLKKDKEIFIKNYSLWADSSQNTLSKIESSTTDTLKSLELQIKQTEETLSIAKKTKDITLKWLENSIRDAEISYDVSAKDYAKLTITSPIDWVISDIFVDEWQDVSPQTQILTIISDNASEVELSFKENELSYIKVWDEAFIKLADKTLTWSIYSISSVSDDSLNYKVLAVFSDKIQNLGWVVNVSIPVKTDSILLPIKYVKLVWTNKWVINLFDNWKILKKEVNLWKMYKENIEFISFVDWTRIDEKTTIVLTDVTNFDANKFKIKIEN